MKSIPNIIILVLLNMTESFCSELIASKNSFNLFSMSLQSIKERFTEEESKILKRIYPKLFNLDEPPERSGISNFISNDPLFYPFSFQDGKSFLIEKIDLSGLNIERISLKLSNRLKGVKVLNLSNNLFIKIDEPWIEFFYDNLEELNLNYCSLNENLFETLKHFKKLERLSISRTKILDTLSESFLAVIKKLKHLDVSYCHLNTNDFLNIIKNAENLESLNFSGNSLANLSDLDVTNDYPPIFIHESELKESSSFLSSTSCEISYTETKPSDKTHQANFHMQKIKVLNLENCSITAEDFIIMLFRLPNLEILNLSKNAINFDFRGVSIDSKLKRLELEKCGINKSESLTEFANFKNLEVLNISDNDFRKLRGKFKIGCSKDSLVDLRISNCNLLLESLEQIAKCSKLEKLDVSKSLFGFMTPKFDFGNLKNTVIDLNISGSNLRSRGLEALRSFSKLQKLNLSLSLFSGISKNFDFGKLKETLIELDISKCDLNKEDISVFTDFPKLQILNASENDYNLQLDDALKLGSSKKSLIKLLLKSCKLRESDLKEITSCLRLHELDIQFNNFESIDENFELGNIGNTLHHLNMTSCRISSIDLKVFTKFTNLQGLNLSHNFLNFNQNFDFGNLKKTLRELDLENCCLSSNSMRALASFEILEKLNFKDNYFNFIHEEFDFGNLKNTLIDLNVSSCILSFDILKLISKFSKLQKLDLSDNNLGSSSGTIDFGKLRETLVEFNLSKCKLNSKDFYGLTHFFKLKKLDFSYNSLKKIRSEFDLGNLKQTLVCLNLANTSVRVNYILKGISQCTKLQTLDLRNNILKSKMINSLASEIHELSIGICPRTN